MQQKKYTIIIVEDDAMLLKYLCSSFKGETDCVVFSATNGEDGEKLIFEKNPDFILLDIIMPKKNGFEVLEAVRKKFGAKRPYVVMLSNLGQGADKEQARKLGADDYWVKVDLEVKDIVRKVSELLHTSSS